MKIDFSAMLKDLYGMPVRLNETKDSPEARLADIVLQALGAPANEAADRKLRCYSLMNLVKGGGDIELTKDDVALLREKIAAAPFPTVVIGRAFDLLTLE